MASSSEKTSARVFPSPGISLGPDVRLIDGGEPTRIQEAGGESAGFRLYREMADLPVIARFTVEGEPTSKTRARFVRRGPNVGTYSPEKNREAELRVAWRFRQAAGDYRPDDNTAYGVMGVFYSGTQTRRDVDNMMKLILDGLNGVAWPDDHQVVEISSRKCLVPPPEARSEIVVYQVGPLQRFLAGCLNCGKEFEFTSRKTAPKYCGRACSGMASRKGMTNDAVIPEVGDE